MRRRPPSRRPRASSTPSASCWTTRGTPNKQYRRGLQKAVRIDIDLEAGRAAETHPAEPVVQHCLQVDAALGLDQKAPAVAPAQDGERGGSRAEYADAGQL